MPGAKSRFFMILFLLCSGARGELGVRGDWGSEPRAPGSCLACISPLGHKDPPCLPPTLREQNPPELGARREQGTEFSLGGRKQPPGEAHRLDFASHGVCPSWQMMNLFLFFSPFNEIQGPPGCSHPLFFTECFFPAPLPSSSHSSSFLVPSSLGTSRREEVGHTGVVWLQILLSYLCAMLTQAYC